MKSVHLLLMAFVATGACVGSVDRAMTPERSHLPVPIRLSDSQRNQIAQHFDAGAVEQIANQLGEEERRAFLAPFGGVPGEAPAPRRRGGPQEVSLLVRHSDPKIQALIEEMWAPYWEHLPPEALTDPTYRFPGKKIAAERMRLRQAQLQSPPEEFK